MTPQNVISGFKVTGVFPVNRRAIVLPGERPHYSTPTAALAKKKGIHYMPFYSPSVRFSEEEVQHYERRYEEGFDMTHDDHYNQWLKLNHPESLRTKLFSDTDSGGVSPSSSSTEQLSPKPVSTPTSDFHQSSLSPQLSLCPPDDTSPPPKSPPKSYSKLSEFLPVPVPVTKKGAKAKESTGARVLTSTECVKMIEERAQKKKEEAELKLQRQQERERKKQERQEKAKEVAERKTQRQKEQERKKQERLEKAKEVAQRKIQRQEQERKKQEMTALQKQRKEKQKKGETECSRKCCSHPHALNWVSCEDCEKWLHCVCVCVGVNFMEAKKKD